MAAKLVLSVYWASSCGGCEIAVVNLHEHLLDLDRHFDLVFCPCLMDGKKKDVADLPDGAIDLTLFNGAIRTAENEEMAHLLRRKSKLLVAEGACACGGGVPALSNLSTRRDHLRAIYGHGLSTENPGGTLPQERFEVAEGTLHLPHFFDRVQTLAQTVEVDYYLPGCPPESEQIWSVLATIASGAALPARGSVLGGGTAAVCAQCTKTRTDKRIAALGRLHELVPDPTRCLLDQGLLCVGPTTRDGCGARCPQANMPCSGCYGPAVGVHDQGGKMAGTVGAILDISPLKAVEHDRIEEAIDERLDAVPDLAGAFYKFSLAGALARRGSSGRVEGER